MISGDAKLTQFEVVKSVQFVYERTTEFCDKKIRNDE